MATNSGNESAKLAYAMFIHRAGIMNWRIATPTMSALTVAMSPLRVPGRSSVSFRAATPQITTVCAHQASISTRICFTTTLRRAALLGRTCYTLGFATHSCSIWTSPHCWVIMNNYCWKHVRIHESSRKWRQKNMNRGLLDVLV